MQEKEKSFLLGLARETIEYGVQNNHKLPEIEIPKELELFREKKGVFVTLKKDRKLRGCIGNILPVYPLFEAVIRNANSAAFEDPRFYPLTESELKDIKIEISILTIPEKIQFNGYEELKKLVRPNIDGVVLKYGFKSATYLPQVWEEVSNPDEFFFSLAMKAGLNPSVLYSPNIEIETYQVESFSEEDFK